VSEDAGLGEGRRAAVLDDAHHLELEQAQVAGVGKPPRIGIGLGPYADAL
jgi:hypothetical protein